ncbi:hypothetical protein [Streptomyces sp. S.PB5]|uniref:hypothetical protein n=1 Tax=Streptomyces sp. S.PB5 TaxID=3020844 RepID=UPI0025B1E277|nr:hypothetical protein [Streptomyces sp. S.PB5]MDN3027992.1 hypothetical protein [Streptomyces sp. S.PB5]
MHASTRRDEPLTTDAVTGEVRVPLALYAVDERRADVDLVLSRTDGQRLFTELAEALGFVRPMPAPRALGAVQ